MPEEGFGYIVNPFSVSEISGVFVGGKVVALAHAENGELPQALFARTL